MVPCPSLGIKLGASHMIGKYSVTQLYPQTYQKIIVVICQKIFLCESGNFLDYFQIKS
jgi:hypothetical protein